jgi:hypothetical protein
MHREIYNGLPGRFQNPPDFEFSGVLKFKAFADFWYNRSLLRYFDVYKVSYKFRIEVDRV